MANQILIIDDEGGIRDALRQVLEYENYEVRVAATGIDGILLFHETRPDLVILDLKLQGGAEEGLDILRQIREADPNVAVIMISGHATIRTAVEATRIGANDFLEKPLDADRLLMAIRDGLTRAEPKRLRIRLEIGEFVDEEFVVTQVVRLYEALNRAHIAGGGAGLVFDDWNNLVPAHDLEGTPA